MIQYYWRCEVTGQRAILNPSDEAIQNMVHEAIDLTQERKDQLRVEERQEWQGTQ